MSLLLSALCENHYKTPCESFKVKKRSVSLSQGLTIVASVLEGPLLTHLEQCRKGQKSLRAAMNRNLVQGFPQVIASDSIQKGMAYLLQGCLDILVCVDSCMQYRRGSGCPAAQHGRA